MSRPAPASLGAYGGSLRGKSSPASKGGSAADVSAAAAASGGGGVARRPDWYVPSALGWVDDNISVDSGVGSGDGGSRVPGR